MSFHLPSGHHAHHHQSDAREQARRLTLGLSTAARPHRRPHRVDLPDVDVSRITRIPRRSLLKGLAALLGMRAVAPGMLPIEMSGAPPQSDGTEPEKAYVGAAPGSAQVPEPTSSRRLAA